MKSNEELLAAAFERSELVIKEKSAVRKRIAASASAFMAVAAITTAVFVSGGADRSGDMTPPAKETVSASAAENAARITGSSAAERAFVTSENSEQQHAESFAVGADSALASAAVSSKESALRSENASSRAAVSEKGDRQAPSENTALRDGSAAGSGGGSHETRSLAEATSDIDPAVDRSRIPDVSKVAVSMNTASVAPNGSAQSEAFDPNKPDAPVDTEVWYDPDVFYDAGGDEKGYDDASQLIDDAQAVIVGTVESIAFEAPPSDEDPMAKTVTPDGWRMGTIYTVYTVKTEKVYKGELSSEQSVKIYSFGGIRDNMVSEQLAALGGDRMIPIADRLDAQPGGRYIFILADRTHYVPVNAGQSIYAADDMAFASLYGDITTEAVYNALER